MLCVLRFSILSSFNSDQDSRDPGIQRKTANRSKRIQSSGKRYFQRQICCRQVVPFFNVPLWNVCILSTVIYNNNITIKVSLNDTKEICYHVMKFIFWTCSILIAILKELLVITSDSSNIFLTRDQMLTNDSIVSNDEPFIVLSFALCTAGYWRKPYWYLVW